MTAFVALTDMAKVWRRHVAESFCGSLDLHGLPPSAVTHELFFSFRTPNTSTRPALLKKREHCIGVASDPVCARLFFLFFPWPHKTLQRGSWFLTVHFRRSGHRSGRQ